MKENYTSAEVKIPIKLISNPEVLEMLLNKKLSPVHPQIYPTNRCNLNCSFCSCSDRDKNKELPLETIKNYVLKYPSIQAVTISGGGEPLMYTHLEGMIKFFKEQSILIGMATNGLLLGKYPGKMYENFTWIRISISEASLDNDLYENLESIIPDVKTGWAFSFVAGEKTGRDIRTIEKFYKRFENHITHFRVVNNILSPDNRVGIIKEVLCQEKTVTDKFIFQKRQEYKRGANKCYLAALKPVLGADENLYPCCGIQYAIMGSKHDNNKDLIMGRIGLAEKETKNYFQTNGICDKCYYSNYNDLIDMYFNDIQHKEFI